MSAENQTFDHDIAIIGIAGRFPGARDIDELWRVVRNGAETITFFTDSELLAADIPAETVNDPQYVKACGKLDQVEYFDAHFFGYSPREAEILDPQQRIFLEEAWHALEHAGYNPETYRGRIGVYGGSRLSSYLLQNLNSHPELWKTRGNMQIMIGNDKDTLTNRVSYKLNLRGPAINVQTACSTSLVAVHLACQSLLSGENDMALAGGCAIGLPQIQGYFYREGSIGSSDGHCRAFDARATGTTIGSGVGLVVLKRLANALADGDTIHAVIKGSAINNDGALKVGFTAPGIEGQAEVIADALALAEVSAEKISYIEAHGTGTTIGDPIEIAALNRVYQTYTKRKHFCAIGSIKTNMGHLDAAAGITGLIKTALALKHQELPPHLHFEQPNPEIDFENSPFYVNTHLAPWPATDGPRLAGVSSFGIGGTNAHVIVTEAPAPSPSGPSRPWQVIPLSAKTVAALDQQVTNLVTFLQQSSETDLANLAYTCQVGRGHFHHRLVCVCQNNEDAITVLRSRSPQRVFTRVEEQKKRPVAFLFPGQGPQYVEMGRELYQHEPVFRAQIDRCAGILRGILGLDIREILYPEVQRKEEEAQKLSQTGFAQPILFSVEYALAQFWIHLGLRPCALLGHSMGEYVAACVADVFSLEDGLALIATRARLMESTGPGAMLSILLSEEELMPLLPKQLDLAVVNGPMLCTVAGPVNEVEIFQTHLNRQGIDTRWLRIPSASHSALMEPLLDDLLAAFQGIELREPRIPYISNVTGTWITAREATDPSYWQRHLRQTARFADGIAELLKEPDLALLELGPGRTLSTLVQQTQKTSLSLFPTLPHAQDADETSSQRFFLETLGKLWLVGVHIDWSRFTAHERRQRIPLPLYPFDRQRYWIETRRPSLASAVVQAEAWEANSQSDETTQDTTTIQQYARADLLTTYAAPENEVERAIASVWERVLGIEPVGIHDNFFELGGHSLLLTQVTAQLNGLFPVEFSLRRLLQAETVAQMAVVAEELLIEKIEELSEEEVERFL